MKKMFLFAASVILMAFASCTPTEEPLPDADKDVNDVENTDDIDPNWCTNVTIAAAGNSESRYVVVDKVYIYNEAGKQVGTGGYFGDYLVPYNGSIEIHYSWAHSSTYYEIPDPRCDRYEVGTANHLYIFIEANVGFSSPLVSLRSYVGNPNSNQ